jgi:hypothetical protein
VGSYGVVPQMPNPMAAAAGGTEGENGQMRGGGEERWMEMAWAAVEAI